jgi:hypothetical protein
MNSEFTGGTINKTRVQFFCHQPTVNPNFLIFGLIFLNTLLSALQIHDFLLMIFPIKSLNITANYHDVYYYYEFIL